MLRRPSPGKRAWGAECFNCHGRNHFSSVCREKPTGRSRNNFVRTESAAASRTPSNLYNASLYRTDAKGVGCEQEFSLIRRGHRNLVLSKDDQPKLMMYSGACLHPTGRLMVEVKHDDQSRELPLLVVPGNGPCLLDRDWLELLHMNWSRIKKTSLISSRSS